MMCRADTSSIAIRMFVAISLAACTTAPPLREMDASISAAQNTLHKIQLEPANEALGDKLKEAKAVLIISAGIDRCVVLRHDRETRQWRGPAFYHVTKVKAVGQVYDGSNSSTGKQDLELVALAMTDKAVEWLMSPQSPRTGSPGFIVANRESSGQGSADMILFQPRDTVTRPSDLGAIILTIDKAANQTYYGRLMTPAAIFALRSVDRPDAAAMQRAVSAATR